MKCSDYVVKFLALNNIKHVFGYPGGMATHLMESFRKYNSEIQAHICYHEQAASFAACGYAQVSGNAGAAYSTSGPGATNLITGICNAYFDSIPVIFITCQVNRNESSRGTQLRQRGFQETDIISIVKSITKFAAYIDEPSKLPEILSRAYTIAMQPRRGPVLLDIPMDVLRADIEIKDFISNNAHNEKIFYNSEIIELLRNSRRPCIIFGAALKDSEGIRLARELADTLKIPCLSSMPAVDILAYDCPYKFGFIGAYGSRTANFIAAKSDLILALSSRLDIRQVGALRENFASDSRIIRIDIDSAELAYNLHSDDININAEVKAVIKFILSSNIKLDCPDWLKICCEIRGKLSGLDDLNENNLMSRLSDFIPDESIIIADVGQNQVWTAQSFRNKPAQKILFSSGLGSMGYSLPASIGAYYASGEKIISINGDGGFQMNIQELQFIAREKLPVKIIVFNNHSLGMLRHFQEMYFDRKYFHTTEGSGYTVPKLSKIAAAYGLDYYCFKNINEINGDFMENNNPALIEIDINHETIIQPKSRFGQPAQNQEPLLDKNLYSYIMQLGQEKYIERPLTNMENNIIESGIRNQESGIRNQES